MDELARTAGLSRTAFYLHFADRRHLILTVLGELGDELSAVADVWTDSGVDPVAEQRAGLAALVQVFVRHGRTLQAVKHAAALDPEVAAAWDGLSRGLVDLTAAGIRRDNEAGHSDVRDPEHMSVALSALTENYLLTTLGRHPLADPAVVTDTVSTIWIRALYDARLRRR